MPIKGYSYSRTGFSGYIPISPAANRSNKAIHYYPRSIYVLPGNPIQLSYCLSFIAICRILFSILLCTNGKLISFTNQVSFPRLIFILDFSLYFFPLRGNIAFLAAEEGGPIELKTGSAATINHLYAKKYFFQLLMTNVYFFKPLKHYYWNNVHHILHAQF